LKVVEWESAVEVVWSKFIKFFSVGNEMIIY